jgi:phenylalanyl-tRNA synthetase beta chain
MVYVYAKKSELNKYIGKELSVDEITNILMDMGMDIKGQDADDDPELKIEITAEKLDMVSAVGIGRAIKFYGGYSTDIPKYDIKPSGYSLYVKGSAKHSRPKTVCAILRDVPMSDEFLEEMIKIQEKIHESFGRGRKKGAIGIYPLDSIEFPITFGAEDPEEIVFKPLDFDREVNGRELLEVHDTGRRYAHLLKDCNLFPVFRDAKQNILSMPPIINSHKLGKVTKSDKDLFIECSGNNLSHLDNILKVLVTTFMDMGASAQSIEVVYEESGEIYNLDLSMQEDEIDLDFVSKWIGVEIDNLKVGKLLNKVMYEVRSIDFNKVKIGIPAYRSDVWHDVDVADDIARAYGYNNIVPRFPNVSSVGSILPFSRFKENFRECMKSLGFLELYTYMLSSTTNQFNKMGLDVEKSEFIKLVDSEDQGLNMVRTLILPENLMALHVNRKHSYPQKVFECGFTIKVDDSTDTRSKDESHLCIAIADPKSNYTQIKGVLDTLLKLHGIKFSVSENDYDFLIEGRRADVLVKGIKVGFIGELHPQVLDNFGLLVPVSVLEIDLDKLYSLIEK